MFITKVGGTSRQCTPVDQCLCSHHLSSFWPSIDSVRRIKMLSLALSLFSAAGCLTDCVDTVRRKQMLRSVLG